MVVTIQKELDDFWATSEEFKKMSDGEIIELVKEDIWDFLNGATWVVSRDA